MNDKKKEIEKGFLLDLDKPEYDDLFITSTDERELWQRDAMRALIDKLAINLTAAKGYNKQRQANRKKTNLSHNSIFLTGERGSGKTAFLRNVEPIWKNKNEMGLDNDIGFLDVIDPTMLMNNDSFANVVVAEIYRKVEEYSSDNNVNSTDRTAFYNALKSLSESLGKQDEFNGHSGIDKILRYNSGIQVEKNFHRYVEEAIKILCCSALVLPIDDVDMSLQKAHEVIDDVRRLLGCPYIIPIVSGDVALYQQMINVDFDDRAYKKDSNDDLKQSGLELAKDLSDEYLKKVFPAQMRLPLSSVHLVTSSLKLREKEVERDYSVYMDRFYSRFHFLLHNQQKRQQLPIPKTARDLTQLVRSFSLSNLETKQAHSLWSTYRGFCETSKDGEGYVDALSYLIASGRKNNPSFSIRELPAFNPILQLKENYSWARKKLYQPQMDAINNLGNKENIRFLNSTFKESDRTLSPMPPYEFFTERFNISGSVINNKENQNYRLLDIYTSNSYYSTMTNSAPSVFVGRAFEIILLSFLSTGDSFENQLSRIMSDIPLHSVFYLDNRKHVEYEATEDDEVIEAGKRNESASWLLSEIETWKKDHNEFFSKVDGLSLIPLFARVFNQVFTQINLLKSRFKGKAYEGEMLSDFARRFEHILVNSALMNINDVDVVIANTSLTTNHETIRDYTAFSKRDRTLIRNFENLKNSLHENAEKGVLFVEALWDHPIFRLNNSRGVLVGYYPLGKQSATRRDDQLNELALEDIIGRLEQGIVNNINSDKTDWNNAKKIVDRLISDLAISNDVKGIDTWLKSNKDIAIYLKNIFKLNGYFDHLSSAKGSKAKRFLSAIRVI